MRHPSHRHYVILPLLALSVLGTGVAALHGGSLGLTAITVPAGSSQGEIFEHVSGMRGILLPGAQMDLQGDLPVLQEGSALIAADRPVALRVGVYTLLSVGGGYHVTNNGDAVTIAALTAPVLIEAGALRAAVPAGTQWRLRSKDLTLWGDGIAAWMDARRVTPLPKRFAVEQQEALRTITAASLPEPRTEVSAFIEAHLPELPEAHARRREQWTDAIFGALRFRVEAEDAAGVQELLLRSDLAGAFSTDRAKAAVSALLFAAERSTALQQQLLPILTKDSDLWLLLSLHPQVSTVVWTLPQPPHSSEAAAVRLLTFPFADFRDEAGHAQPWGRWEEGLLASVLAAKDPGTVAGELITRLGNLAIDREAVGYPERARSIAKALRTLGDALGKSISPEAREMLNALSRFDRVDVRMAAELAPAPVAPKVASAFPVVKEHFDPVLVEWQAREMLRSAGAAFSLETRIIPESVTRALIENIVFAGSTRDRTLTFTLDLERSEVLVIHEGGEEYPYALPMQAFTEWIRR
ncbi:hypothetical protein A3C37_00695 [Candidatus Peribacteria bacterium RIFCSPHIGHO2_02_FULL_53_20]|nr:MAG: hypothetical protein A3C37_00695 [Candidatus Peribacteria bacterium RIFCSPHIGHO2_02_FULL_53_20]OGJ67305.1 MAG: hypothetical protein A3B61_01185 [Candidatus Peribacteria bacterium RIFCSPLOWO2_01_FULL_53_10]OGJ74193.1 MAG: hypothetical protein A3G69_03150 [Candidatus Peribacteria bacterium RIFCSPLOWO2_12_FULL_53_10]